MPLNIITKLKTKNIFNSNFSKALSGMWIAENLIQYKHKLEINHEKKSNGNGPKVVDSSASSSYWQVIKIPSPRPFSDLI